MESKGIDVPLSLEILEAFNVGRYDHVEPVVASGVPAVDGRSVIDMTRDSFHFDKEILDERAGALGLDPQAMRVLDDAPAIRDASTGREAVCLDKAFLRSVGLKLCDATAFGVLNGGSATSYADSKKNAVFGHHAIEAYRRQFDLLAPLCEGKPKGITPAYINPDFTPGESFLLMRFRALLLLKAEYRARFGDAPREILPGFQMTSLGTDAALAEAYAEYACHPWLAPLARELGCAPISMRTGVQPMISAFTHSAEGRPKRLFDAAYGQADSALALPGGHGQSFRVLKDVFAKLKAEGYRFAYFGNVDNSGCLPDPVEIALLALSGKKAGFDFSFRTPVDVKGGVLVLDGRGRMNCPDIGPAIHFDEIKRLEATGEKILFNCATGLFDLDWLVPNLDRVANELPVRFTDQDKDSGKYSQAEQVTWEVMGLLDDFMGFAVDKYERFIAAKLLMETILTSGLPAEGEHRLSPTMVETAGKLHAGLHRILTEKTGLKLANGRYVPR